MNGLVAGTVFGILITMSIYFISLSSNFKDQRDMICDLAAAQNAQIEHCEDR